MQNKLKVRDAPHYVSTGTVLNSNGKYFAGTSTIKDAIKIVTSISLFDNLVNKLAMREKELEEISELLGKGYYTKEKPTEDSKAVITIEFNGQNYKLYVNPNYKKD